MRVIEFKEGVYVEFPLSPALEVMFEAIQRCWPYEHGHPVVTALQNGKHMRGSFHEKKRAIDLRSKNLPDSAAKHAFRDLLLEDLGDRDFDVILESEGKDQEHFHCEFDPT